MAEKALFKCLRCGHQHTGDYMPKVVQEKTCPNCASNSVRRIKASQADKPANS